MQTVLEEAREAYASEIVIELQSEDPTDVEENVERIDSWIKQWRLDQGFADLEGRLQSKDES